MKESDLVHDTLDWFLPLKHEAQYWRQFMGGGRTMIDIGAHVGTWTLNLAPYFERVFCFEPDPRGYVALQENVRRAGLTNVEVIGKAVSDKRRKVLLTCFPNPCTNTMMSLADAGRTDANIGSIEVDCETVDEFTRDRDIRDLDFIKIDAEGAEMLICRGAEKTFKMMQPDFFIEMHGHFWERLRALIPTMRCDVLDGGRAGLSLLRHRDRWPGFSNPKEFRVYPHPRSPTDSDLKELRALHGIAYEIPEGWRAVDGRDH